MSRTLAAVTGGVTLLGLVQIAPSAQAQACPDEAAPIVVTARATDTVLYRTGGTTRLTATAHDDHDDEDPCGTGVRKVTASFVSERGGVRRGPATLSLVSGDTFDGTWQGSFHFSQHAFAGRWRLDARAVDHWGNSRSFTGLDTFFLRRNTTLTLDGRPEPAPAGERITLSGQARKLTRYGGYVGYDTTVHLQFRPQGTDVLKSKGTTTTGPNGYYSVRRTAYRAGTWIAITATTSTYARSVAKDFVDTS